MKDEALVLPHDPGWDEARLAWNLAVDQQPAAVALPESAADVAAVVRWARRRALRVAAQGTGHGAAALGSLAHTVLVKTERMRGIEIDTVAQTARVDAGVLSAEVTEAAAEHGLAVLAGSSPDVGIVGYTLGGGLSWFARRHGLAANSVTAVELVKADGELVRADPDNHADLFWALRGGGGAFGVVTALEFALYPIAEAYAGALFFPLERGAEVLRAWRRWTESVSDDVSSVGRLLRFPAIPHLPEPLRGGSFVVVEAAYIGDEASAAEVLHPLRELAPALDTFATVPIERLSSLHMDPDRPVAGVGDGMLLADLPDDSIDALARVAGPGSNSPLISVELRHLGGALDRSAPGHGALDKLHARFAVGAVGAAPTPERAAVVRAHVEALQSALAGWDAGRDFLNFTQRRERGERLFGTATYRRLQAVKAHVDPDDVFRSNHPIRLPSARLKRVA